MSIKEIKEFCESTQAHGVRVKMRLKNEYQTFIGRVRDVGRDQFIFCADETIPAKTVRYNWVANINNA